MNHMPKHLKCLKPNHGILQKRGNLPRKVVVFSRKCTTDDFDSMAQGN